MRARQNECQLAALGLLVLPHDVDKIGNGAEAVPQYRSYGWEGPRLSSVLATLSAVPGLQCFRRSEKRKA